MRDELKALNENEYWCYGVDESSLDHCYNLVKNFIKYQQSDLSRQCKETKTREPESGIHDEIISDLSHYAWCDAQVLWQLALWRSQGIFESIIKYTFLKTKPHQHFTGLVAKLDAAKKAGFELSDEEFNSLRDWGKLRNAITHAPPEPYRPVVLEESDLKEYIELVKKICARWRIKLDTKQ